MAAIAGTYQTYTAIGRREDLANTIYNISPSDVPFMSMIGRSKATNTLAEWQTDTLAAAAHNAQIEGDLYSFATVPVTTRLSNHTQISSNTVMISGSQQASNNAGRDSEMALQLAKNSKQLKRDMETVLTQNVAKSAGTATAARKTGGLETWTSSNVSRGSGSTVGSGAGAGAAPVDAGTKRAFTETILKAVIQATYSSGGDPSVLMVGPFNKGVVSGFTGRSSARQMIGESKIQAAADLYASDFGDLKVIPNRFQRETSGFVLDPEYWSVAYFRDFKQEDIAKTSDANKKALLVEYALIAKNQAASGICADLTVS